MYEINQTETFNRWLHDLKDLRAKARIRARIERAQLGNFGDWSPEGGEIRAIRIDYGPGKELFRNKVYILAVYFPLYCVKKNLTYFLVCAVFLSLSNEKYPR